MPKGQWSFIFLVFASFLLTMKYLNDIQRSKSSAINKQQTYIKIIQCHGKQKHIVFLKTHKTGSSTITNILNRYADFHNLSVVVPAGGLNRFGWPAQFSKSYVDQKLLGNEKGDIILNHAVYNRVAMDSCMSNNSKYITILRDPVTHFESTYNYFHLAQVFRYKDSKQQFKPLTIEEFLKNPSIEKLPKRENTWHLAQNGMLFDLGRKNQNVTAYIQKLAREFDLVLITEYFDESLVLLKMEFCLDFKDILYVKQNSRLLSNSTMSQKSKKRIRDWNSGDVMLYNYFNKTLWSKIKSYGDEFWKELKIFKLKRKEFLNSCSFRKVAKFNHYDRSMVQSYQIGGNVTRKNKVLCEKSLVTEPQYITYYRKKYCVNCKRMKGKT